MSDKAEQNFVSSADSKETERMNQKRLAVAGISAAMLAGAGAGLALTWPGGAGASGSTAVSSAPVDPTGETATTTPTSTESTEAPAPDDTDAEQTEPHKGPLTDILDQLVAAGTITQEQADAIKSAIEAQKPAGEFPGRHGGWPGRDGAGRGLPGLKALGGMIGGGLDAAANAIGITADELKTELMNGKTIADVATEHGVDVQKVVDAIVAEATKNLNDVVTDIVNGVRPAWPKESTESSEATTTTTG